jgi:hypothetical protein
MKIIGKIFIMIMVFQITRCAGGSNKAKADRDKNHYSGTCSWEVVDRDTINKTNCDGKKQGRWILFSAQLRGKLNVKIEEGNYVNNLKQGLWKYYDSTEKLVRVVNFKNDQGSY